MEDDEELTLAEKIVALVGAGATVLEVKALIEEYGREQFDLGVALATDDY